MNNIPIHFLSKMGKYELDIQGNNVKVTVVDHAALIDDNIAALKALLKRQRLVGIDVKFNHRCTKKAEMLILCAGNRCLIIQLCHLGQIPESLKKFLADETICFAGMEMNGKVDGLGRCNLRCKTAVELGHLAARVLKKPHISSFGLAKLAREVGIHNSLASGFNGYAPSWSARAFSNEQIKFASHEAFAYYVIGDRVLSSLDA